MASHSAPEMVSSKSLYRLTPPGLPGQQIQHAAQALPLTHTRLKRWDLVCRTVAA